MTKRHQSQTERDMQGLAAKRDRESVPFEVPEEITGSYEGDELQEMRELRPTDKRIGRLEQKHDSLARVVNDFRADIGAKVGEMSGKLDVLPKLVEMVSNAQHLQAQDNLDARKHSRERVTKIIGGAIALVTSGAFIGWWLS